MTPTELLTAIDGDAEWTIEFTHSAAPKSKARPRVVTQKGRSFTYTPPGSKSAEDQLAWMWRAACRGEPRDGCLALACIFYRPNRQRIDVDNMTKLVMDAGTKARVWYDDSQITTIVARIEIDPELPRTEIALRPSPSTLSRQMFQTGTCPSCGDDFTRAMSAHVSGDRSAPTSMPKFCSPRCARDADRVIATCIQCEQPFERKRAGQSLCSHRCRDINLGRSASEAVAQGRRKGPPLCEKCGSRVSRREYRQCAACLGRGRSKLVPSVIKPDPR